MPATKTKARRAPAAREKCRSEARNGPGWLTLKTYVAGDATCVVDPAGGSDHHVRVVNDSPLQYELVVEVLCRAKSLSYVPPHTRPRKERWKPSGTVPGRTRRNGPGKLDRKKALFALLDAADEQITVTARWDCVDHAGSGTMDKIVIAVDAVT